MTSDPPPPLVPKLRFPEFRDAPAWEVRSLRSVCERIMDGTHFSPKTKDGPRPYLTSKNIRDGRLDLSTVSFISEEEHRDIYARCPVKTLDVLLTKDGANTGTCAINTLDYEFSLLSSVAVLRGDAECVNQEFLYQTIANDRTQSTIINSMAGQAITRITLEKLGNYVVPLPGLPEQQRIAACLTSADDLIAAEGRKLDALRWHKQGLMQQLFPQSGEAVPRLRFPECEDAPDWKVTCLSEAFGTITNGRANAQDHQEDGEYPLFDRSEVVKRSPTFLFDAEAVIIPGEGMSFQPRYFKGKFNLHQRAYALMEPTVVPLFAFYAIDRFKDALADSAVHSTVRSLRMPIIEQFAIPCPQNDREQRAIADCLASLDSMIATQAEILNAVRTHKRGLMQQLFPDSEAR